MGIMVGGSRPSISPFWFRAGAAARAASFFPLVWTAFWLNAITGTILPAADATTKLTNPDFGVKMASIVLAVINQRMIQKVCLAIRVDAGAGQRGRRPPAMLARCRSSAKARLPPPPAGMSGRR
jgi:hypothetical protein